MTDKQQIAILRKALVDVVQKLGEMPGWRKVEDGLPEVGIQESFYGLVTDGRSTFPAWRWLKRWNHVTGEKEIVWTYERTSEQVLTPYITHWMEWPEPFRKYSTSLAETLQAICASALGDISIGEDLGTGFDEWWAAYRPQFDTYSTVGWEGVAKASWIASRSK